MKKKRIRRSQLEDAEQFIAIKEKLSLVHRDKNQQRGGFLLGTNLETYQFYIQDGISYSALDGDKVVGFGIVLPNELVKQSELWEKRKAVDWQLDVRILENSNVAYFEQLAFLEGYRKWVILLAHHLADTAFTNGADYILTTTVRKPILNLAAVPLIQAAGGRKVGNIDEVYPEVGDINSDIYMIPKATYYQKLKERRLYRFLLRNSHL